MTTGKLLWGTTWRGAAWGLGTGFILAAAYGVLVIYWFLEDGTVWDYETPLIEIILGISGVFAFYGFWIAVPLGLLPGTVNGFLVGMLLRPPSQKTRIRYD